MPTVFDSPKSAIFTEYEHESTGEEGETDSRANGFRLSVPLVLPLILLVEPPPIFSAFRCRRKSFDRPLVLVLLRLFVLDLLFVLLHKWAPVLLLLLL